MAYKTLKGLTYMSDMFRSVWEVSSQLTRFSQANKLYVHRKDLYVSRSLKYSGAVLYDTLGTHYLGKSVSRYSFF